MTTTNPSLDVTDRRDPSAADRSTTNPVEPVEPVDEPTRWSPPRVSEHGWITAAIAVMATFFYTWNLSANGYANDYYAAAVKAGTVSWKAFFFGSIDPGSFITVDKPPAALWLQSLSARIFGFSSWSMLLPEALCGVASVLILHHLVRRWAGDVAAHLAAAAFALTPVAVLMFRFNNPEALLTLLCLAAAWALWTAYETGRTRYLLLSAALVGLAFNTKMLQAFVILPAFILFYLVAGRPAFWRRIGQLLAALGTLVVASSWWVVIVTLIPAADRPFIGSTSDNSILSLIFGYNGLSRLFGESGGAGPGGGGGFGGGGAGPGGGNIGFGGAVSWLRMFNPANGSQISWLIPLAVAGLLAGLWVSRRAPRTDRYRAGWLLWGVWALVSLVLFSRAEGIFHPYYTVQAAPAVAALAGAGSIALWRLGRTNRWLQWVLPVAILVSATWAVVLLNQTPAYNPWLRPAIIVGATLAVVGLWLGSQLRQRSIVVGAAAVAVVTLLAGPLAFALTTINAPAGGAIVFAGPAVADAGPGGAGGFGRGAGADGGTGDDGGGGFGRGATANSGLVTYLEANQGDATYLVAAFGSQSSAPLIIATGRPVITIGGFNGGDPAPTLAQFQQLVSSGQVRFLLVSGGGGGGGFGGGPGGGGTGQSISTWAAQNGTAVPATAYGGASAGTLYDLSGAA